MSRKSTSVSSGARKPHSPASPSCPKPSLSSSPLLTRTAHRSHRPRQPSTSSPTKTPFSSRTQLVKCPLATNNISASKRMKLNPLIINWVNTSNTDSKPPNQSKPTPKCPLHWTLIFLVAQPKSSNMKVQSSMCRNLFTPVTTLQQL